jgi:threonine dehydratase
MSGHALAIHDAFPHANVIGVEPADANDFQLSLAAGSRQRLEKPASICDGLLSYDVGVHNWPILAQICTQSVVATDLATQLAMKWLYQHHGLRSEPSGAITLAALLNHSADELAGTGDIVIVISGRNVDDSLFTSALNAQS